MAGERMKPGDYTEMTAICVHPDHRGRGYGQMLLGAVARQIWRATKFRSCTCSPTPSAIALYRRQGMEIRQTAAGDGAAEAT